MDLAKSTEAFDSWWDSETSPMARWDQAAFGSRAVDEDLIHAREVKAGLQWVRNDDSPLKRLRWFVWDRYGLGRPPSRVEKRASAEESASAPSDVAPSDVAPNDVAPNDVAPNDVAPSSPVLRVVTPEVDGSGAIGSSVEPTRLGSVKHS